MADYVYKAVNTAGETVTGRMNAASERDAIAQLSRQGFYPISARPAARKQNPHYKSGRRPGRSVQNGAGAAPRSNPRSRRSGAGERRGRETGGALGSTALPFRRKTVPGQDDLLRLTLDLAHTTRAGLSLDQSLRILESGTKSHAMATLLGQLTENLRSGASLSVAMERAGPPFSAFYIALVRAGETAGALPLVLDRLGAYLKRTRDLRKALTTAMIYPVALLTVTILSVTLLMTTVVPRFKTMFARAGAELPIPTQIVLGVAEFLAAHGWLVALALLGGGLAFRSAMAGRAFRRQVHAALLRVPLAGRLIQLVETARFTRALGLSLESGVSMLTAFTNALGTVSNEALAQRLGEAEAPLRAGSGLAGPLLATDALPGTAAHMIRVGEETGRLGPMLTEIADIQDAAVEEATKRFLATLEPAIILFLGLMVGVIVLSLFAAIVSLPSLAL